MIRSFYPRFLLAHPRPGCIRGNRPLHPGISDFGLAPVGPRRLRPARSAQGASQTHFRSARPRLQAQTALGRLAPLGAGDGRACRAHPPSRNRETTTLLAQRRARVLPICSLGPEGKGCPGHFLAPGSGQVTGTHAPAAGSNITLPCARALPSDCSLYSFDLCLGRVRFPFCHFLWASWPLGSSSSSAPRFPFSLRSPPSCG